MPGLICSKVHPLTASRIQRRKVESIQTVEDQGFLDTRRQDLTFEEVKSITTLSSRMVGIYNARVCIGPQLMIPLEDDQSVIIFWI